MIQRRRSGERWRKCSGRLTEYRHPFFEKGFESLPRFGGLHGFPEKPPFFFDARATFIEIAFQQTPGYSERLRWLRRYCRSRFSGMGKQDIARDNGADQPFPVCDFRTHRFAQHKHEIGTATRGEKWVQNVKN